MEHLFKQRCVACWLLGALVLGGCAAGSGAGGGSGGSARIGAVAQVRDYFPGGSRDYAWGGGGQSKESLVNLARAQYEYSASTKSRHWIDAQVSSVAMATIIGLQAYSPLHVRWKLKDGREFILENIDISAIMREYFKTHEIQIPWQREGRPKDSVGDFEPLLTHEVKDDTVRIKWVIRTNQTPVDQRLTAKGAATQWDIAREEFLVATLKGVPTSGIDFNHRYEVRK